MVYESNILYYIHYPLHSIGMQLYYIIYMETVHFCICYKIIIFVCLKINAIDMNYKISK